MQIETIESIILLKYETRVNNFSAQVARRKDKDSSQIEYLCSSGPLKS